MIDYIDLTTILRVRITVVIALIHHPSINLETKISETGFTFMFGSWI